MVELPPNFQVGQANEGGDCFFHSVAQGLKQIKPELQIDVKSLRLVCRKFAQSQLEDEHSWLRGALKEKSEQINEYIPRIEFTANDFDQNSVPVNVLGLTSPMQGRSEIEGRIICAEYDVKLYVVERHIVEGEEMWKHLIVDSEGSRSVDTLDCNNVEYTLHVKNTGDLHFEPVLRNKAIQHNKQLFSDLSEDGDEENFEVTAGEEPFYIIKSNDSEAENIKKVRKLFERVPKLDINSQGIDNDTSLHIAVRKQELKVIELLLKKGARDVKNDKNKSSLDVGRPLKRREEVIKVLKPDINEIFVEWKKECDQESDDERNKKSKREKGILRLTDGELSPDEDLKLQKDDETIEGEYNGLIYGKRPGTTGMHGQLYEIQLLMLLLLQAEANEKVKKINSFHLATNMQEAGDFDDVVFKYSYSENGVEKSNIIFLQAKHKEAEKGKRFTIDTLLSLSEKGDFLLRKYLSSYTKIKSLEFKKDHLLFQDDIERSDFVIYTNSTWNFDKNSNCVKKVNLEPEDALYFAENPEKYYYKLNANETVKNVLRLSLDFEILVRELAQSVYSGSIHFDKLIFKDYHVSLADRVIQISETNKEESQLRQDFLDGTQDSEFSRAFLEEIRRNKNFSKTFSAKSDDELKEELRNKIIKLPKNFGRAQSNNLKFLLPDKTIPDKTIEKFLDEFKLFLNQPNVNGFEDAIKKMIINVFKIEEKDDPNLIYCDVHIKLTKWWREQEKAKYLTERNKLFSNAKENLSNMNLVGLAILYAKRIKSLGLNFKSDQIESLSHLIREKQILHIISDEDAVLLSTVKVHQALERMIEYKSEDHNYKYIFLSLTSVLELKNRVIGAFKGKRRDLLVIECEGTKTSFRELYDQLVYTVKHNNNKKIVLISQESDPFAEQFKRDFSRDSKYEEKIDKNITLADLDIESQAIIEEKQVIFQGIEINLGTLVDETSKHLVAADVLSQLINGEGIKVDKTPGDLGEVKYYYINRIFHRRVNIRKECFKEKNINDIFVVGNLRDNEFSLVAGGEKVCQFKDTDSDRQSAVRFIALDDDQYVQENMEHLYAKYQAYNIHWLKEEGDKFMWQESHGSLSNLRKFVDMNKINEYPADRIASIVDRIVIVSAEPGMGKSVLLTKLAEKEKKTNPSLWVIRINLNDFTKQLNKISFDKNNLNGTINFLSEIIDLKSPLEKELFKHRVENQGRIAFLFDAFDEISPHYKNKVIALVKILKETKIDKLWITTRPHMRDELEDNLSVMSYSLKPLSISDQKCFLKRFWGRKLDLKDDAYDNRLNIYTEELLKVLSLSIGDEKKDFAEIPLQTRMLAEVYQDQFKEFYNSDQSIPNFSGKLNLLDLYQSFIDKKYNIYWLEKNKADTTIPGVNKVYEEYRSKFILQHQLLALQVLFSNQEVNSLFSVNKQKLLKSFKEDILKGLENTGIITHNFNGTLNFIHRTFAEYFAAFWLVDKKESQGVKIVLQNKLFETENRVLRNFFDRILAVSKNNEIHTAVLNNDIKKCEELLSSGSRNREVDKGGRTALHLAAAYGFLDIAKILLNNKPTGICVKDKIFGWRPLRYADKGSHWDVAELILQRGAKVKDMSAAISNVSSVSGYEQTLLHTAARDGLFKLTELLIQKNANINAKSQYHMTPLSFSAFGGHSDVVKLLIEKGADFNCKDMIGNTVLHCASYSGSWDVVKFLIEIGTDLNCKNKNGDTVLHYAAKRGNWDVVKLLIEAGADFNSKDMIGNTVLHSTINSSSWDVVELLIHKGADINCKNKNGDTILHDVAIKGNLTAVKRLIETGADLNCRNSVGNTVLHSAAQTGSWDIVKLLIEKGADFSGQDKNGYTVLHSAAYSGNLDIVKFLIEEGADLNGRDKKGCTVLYSAAYSGNLDVLKLLIEKGADFNCHDINGHTVLHDAAYYDNLDVVQVLIEKGADLNCRNSVGNTVLHSAAYWDNLNVVEFLIERGADFNCRNNDGDNVLHYAAKKGSWDVVGYLIEKGADFNYESNIGNTVLHYAAKKGSWDVVKFLIEKGAELNCKNKNGDTILHSAAYSGNLDVVKLLIERGADLNGQDRNGNTALHSAGYSGSLDVAKLLIEEGADLNGQDRNGNTALHSAVYSCSWDVVKLLIEKGAEFQCKNKNGYSVLHSVAYWNNLDVVEFLIEKGADFNCQNNEGDNVVHYAAKKSSWNVVKFLIEKGADLNYQNNIGNTVLHYAAKKGSWDVVNFLIGKGAKLNFKNKNGSTVLHDAAYWGNLDVVKLLIEREADFNCQDINGNTVLHSAAERCNWDVVKFLIGKGVDFNCLGKKGNTVLHVAAYYSNLDVLGLLIENGADMNCRNSIGNTVLHAASYWNNFDVVKFLIKKGADFNCQDVNGNTVLHSAASSGSWDVVKLLIEKGADFSGQDKNGYTVLHSAAYWGNMDVVKLLIERGADLNGQDKNGNTALHSAGYAGSLDVVRLIIEKGADLNSQGRNGNTALHSAVYSCSWDVVKLLIEKGAELRCKNKNGYTVLHSAAYWGNLDVVRLLIEKGADLSSRDINGNTALHSAVYSCSWDVVKFLIEEGADFSGRDKNGYTVLHCAAYWGNLDVLKFLIEKGANFNDQDKNGNTALHSAAETGSWDVVKFLIDKGAGFNHKNKNRYNIILHSSDERDY